MVCTQWDDLICQHSGYWRIIDGTRSRTAVGVSLSRAPEDGLIISYRGTSDSLPILLPIAGRFKVLDIVISSPSHSCMSQLITTHMPVLEDVRIKFDGHYSIRYLFGKTAPLLQRLTLVQSRDLPSPWRFTQLQYLELQSCRFDWDDFLQLITHTPGLEELHFDRAHVADALSRGILTPIILPNLRSRVLKGMVLSAYSAIIDAMSTPRGDFLFVTFQVLDSDFIGHNQTITSFLRCTIARVVSSTVHLRLQDGKFLIGDENWCHRLSWYYSQPDAWKNALANICEALQPFGLIVSVVLTESSNWIDMALPALAATLPGLRHLRLVGDGPIVDTIILRIFGSSSYAASLSSQPLFERLDVFGLDGGLLSITPDTLQQLLWKGASMNPDQADYPVKAIEMSYPGLSPGSFMDEDHIIGLGDFSEEWRQVREIWARMENLPVTLRIVHEPMLASMK